MGMLADYFQDFLGLTLEAEVIPIFVYKKGPEEVTQWIRAILPGARFADFF